jgi:hypothetical protein
MKHHEALPAAWRVPEGFRAPYSSARRRADGRRSRISGSVSVAGEELPSKRGRRGAHRGARGGLATVDGAGAAIDDTDESPPRPAGRHCRPGPRCPCISTGGLRRILRRPAMVPAPVSTNCCRTTTNCSHKKTSCSHKMTSCSHRMTSCRKTRNRRWSSHSKNARLRPPPTRRGGQPGCRRRAPSSRCTCRCRSAMLRGPVRHSNRARLRPACSDPPRRDAMPGAPSR